MRGTWLHRKLGDRLFAREMWQPERGRFAFGCALGVFFAMMPVPFPDGGRGIVCFSRAGQHSCGYYLHLGEQPADHAANSYLASTISAHSSWAARQPISRRRTCLHCSRKLRGRPWIERLSGGNSPRWEPIHRAGRLGLVERAHPSISKRAAVKKFPESSKMLLSSCAWGHSSTVRAGGS